MLTLDAAKPHTSISELKCFIGCPRKHTKVHLERAVPAFRPLASVWDNAWHATLAERLARSGRHEHRPIDELREHLRDGIVRGVRADAVPVLFEEEEQNLGAVVDAAMRMLDVFLARVPVPDFVFGIDVPFSLELAHPVTGEVHPVPLVGAMDAIVEEGGHPVVLEFETGGRRWTADQLSDDMQPTAYMMGARSVGYHAPRRCY